MFGSTTWLGLGSARSRQTFTLIKPKYCVSIRSRARRIFGSWLIFLMWVPPSQQVPASLAGGYHPPFTVDIFHSGWQRRTICARWINGMRSAVKAPLRVLTRKIPSVTLLYIPTSSCTDYAITFAGNILLSHFSLSAICSGLRILGS